MGKVAQRPDAVHRRRHGGTGGTGRSPGARAARVAALSLDCEAAILAGYSSSALGSSHVYPNDFKAQINMLGSVAASMLPARSGDWSTPFWAADDAGSWAFRDHSAEQIQQAGSDGKQHVVTCQGTLLVLTAAVAAATDPAGVEAVIWPSAT
jgi:hypothetical protein